MMFKSNLFNFAQAMDGSFVERVMSHGSLDLTLEEVEKAKDLRFETFDVLDLKTRNLNALSRNMGDTTETDAPGANDEDRMTVWFMVSSELKDIEELQDLIRKLDGHLFNALSKGVV